MVELPPKNPETFRVSLTQTAKGFFYIHKVDAYGSTPEELDNNLKRVADIAQESCDSRNIALKGGQ